MNLCFPFARAVGNAGLNYNLKRAFTRTTQKYIFSQENSSHTQHTQHANQLAYNDFS